MKASDLLIKALENEGVEYIFGIPGKENLDILESLRTSSIQLILTRHEQATAFMAAAYGQLRGKAGVCLATSSDATNLIAATHYAQLEAAPLLIITGQEAPANNTDRNSQNIDAFNIMKMVTKMATQITDANTIPTLIAQAFQATTEEPPGAVYITLAEHIAQQKTTNNALSSINKAKLKDPPLHQRHEDSTAPNHLHDDDDDDHYPMAPQRVVSDIYKALPQKAIITLDNGIYRTWFKQYHSTLQTHIVLLNNASRVKGVGLPSAIAAALIHPNNPVMAVCNDECFMVHSQEIETAVRLRLNLMVLIMRDDTYGMAQWQQQKRGFSRFGVEFGNPDFIQYAQSYGAHGHRIQATELFLNTIRKCAQTDGVHIIEIPIDCSEN